MQFAIGVTVLKCSFVKQSHSLLGVNLGENTTWIEIMDVVSIIEKGM
jgi:hypothetical protein